MNRKINEATKILLAFGIIAVLFSGAVAAVEGDKPYGGYIGEYKTVEAYSNGPCVNKFENIYEGKDCAVYNYWQCVEYAKRFYTKLVDTSNWGGLNAYQYYTNAEARGLTPYVNGGSMPPQPDDILGFSGGTYGHVAIITEVGENAITVIEQNVKRNDAVHSVPYNKATNMIGDVNGKRVDIGLYVQGWIRKDAWSFNDGKNDNLDTADRWEPHYVESSEVGTDGKYRINPSIDPWIQHDKLSIVANNYNAIEINMASNAPDGMGKIYFVTASSPIYDENKHIDFYVTNDGNWRTYTIYMKNHLYWSGTITGIRIDPATTGKPGADNTDIIGFDWIKVINTDKRPTIVSASLDYSVYAPGSAAVFSYWIKNPFANNIPDTKLYAAIQRSESGASNGWVEDGSPLSNNIVTLNSATIYEMQKYEKRYQLSPFSLSAGNYDAYLRIYNYGTNDLYDYKFLASAFTISSSPPINIQTLTSAPVILPTATAVSSTPLEPVPTTMPLLTLPPIAPPYEPFYEGSIVTSGVADTPSWLLKNNLRQKITDDETFWIIYNSNGNTFWIFSQTDINTIPQGADITLSTDPDTIQLNWHLEGNDGAAELYQSVDQNILNGKTSVTLTYDLHGLCALGNDASAIIFDQNDWRYVPLSEYGQNCYDGEQTVTIALSDFPNLDINAPLTGMFHTRFWYSGPFTVDIKSVKFGNDTPTSKSSFNSLTLNWHLVGNDGSSELYQSVDQNILNGKTSVTLTYDLHGLCALGNDASAIIFDQNDWRYISLSNYGENCKDGEQTVTIPLSDFPNLDTNIGLTGQFHTRFWSGGSFTVDISKVTWN